MDTFIAASRVQASYIKEFNFTVLKNEQNLNIIILIFGSANALNFIGKTCFLSASMTIKRL